MCGRLLNTASGSAGFDARRRLSRPAFRMRDRQRQRLHFVRRDAAIEGDALDAERLQAADHFAHRLGGARQRHVADDDFVADDADRDRSAGRSAAACNASLRLSNARCTSGCDGAYSCAARSAAASRRTKSSASAEARDLIHYSLLSAAAAAAPVRAPAVGDLAHRARPPKLAASSRARSALGVPMLRSARAAVARMRAVRPRAHHSPR